MSDNQHETALFGPTSFEEVLQEAIDKGSFEAAVLASDDGLPIATVSPTYNADTTAAMVGLLQSASKETREQLGMGEVDELTIVCYDQTRLVCRHLTVDGAVLILAVMVPRGRYYRSVTNQAIKEIKAIWHG